MTGALRSEPGLLPLAFRDLRRSAEPAVVLSSLARLSVSCFSDGCALELSEGLDPVFEVSFPLPDEELVRKNGACDNELPAGIAVITAFNMSSADGHPSFSGHLIHSWTLRSPATEDAVIARMLVDHALEIVRYERLAEIARAAEDRSARLAREAMATLSIGEAIGIEMATRHLCRAAAIELLKDASRQSGRSLHEISVDIVRAATCATTEPSGQPDVAVPPVVNLERWR